ncbi:polynucleotide adenylyltransferase [Haplosporangium sp. Z 11]|nr:polynucleotide adenylyltransferase [Haplosporangium sp. Z 11]
MSHQNDLLDFSSVPNRPPAQRLGVTMPISEAFPTKEDLESTERLLQTLKDQGLFETEEESKRREIVLGKLDKMVKKFVYTVSLRRNLPESIAREAGGKIFTFGSDIDTLCVVPKHVSREDFFEVMHDMLNSRPEVTELTAVPDAFTPVIKMKFSDIPIDLTFARLGLTTIPDSLDLSDDSLLRNLDDRCIRSVNGSRVTDEILRLVPNIPAFRMALRCVKLWAQRRAIYSNMMGFLGGVAWAMLVARVCQLYPNACAATIISRIFSILHQWPWPQPVLLKHIEEGPLQVRVWNPKLYPADRAHKMPIITPAYPSMCSTHNVTDSTMAVMLSEFKDASELVNRIMVERVPWSTLFAKDDFFSRYRHYLQVIASSDSEERHLRWSGLVESRIRHLVTRLERIENLVLAHPYIKGFSKVIQYRTATEKEDAAHGIIRTPPPDQAEAAADGAELKTMYTSTYYIGLCIPAREAGSTAHRKLDLYRPKEDYIEIVKSWDKFDAQSMGIVVQHIRSSALPAEVLDDVDQKKTKRTKPGKKTAAVDTRPPAKKRRSSIGQNGGQNGGLSDAVSTDTPSTTRSAISSPITKGDTSVPSTPVIPQA